IQTDGCAAGVAPENTVADVALVSPGSKAHCASAGRCAVAAEGRVCYRKIARVDPQPQCAALTAGGVAVKGRIGQRDAALVEVAEQRATMFGAVVAEGSAGKVGLHCGFAVVFKPYRAAFVGCLIAVESDVGKKGCISRVLACPVPKNS